MTYVNLRTNDCHFEIDDLKLYFNLLNRLMRAQTLGDTSSLEFMRGRRILEINPDHPIIKDLNVSYFHLKVSMRLLISSDINWKEVVRLWRKYSG